MCYYVGLFTKEKYNYLSVLRKLARPSDKHKVAIDTVERDGYKLTPHPADLHDILASSDFFLSQS